MLLTSLDVEFFNTNSQSTAQPPYCIARLDRNVGAALPYLNAEVGSYIYMKEPPLLAFHHSRGMLIVVDEESISIHPAKNLIEVKGILDWLQRKINEVWERRGTIIPRYTAAPWAEPAVIVRLLPRTDCGQCGQTTCLAFALLAAKGEKGADDCPALRPDDHNELATYLCHFYF